MGAGGGAAGLAALNWKTTDAASARRPASFAPSRLHDAQAMLDALDADTKQSLARAMWTTDLVAADLPADVLAAITSAKNSDAAYGERFTTYLTGLLANPDTFTADYTKSYAVLLDYTKAMSPHQAYAMRNLLGKDASRGYQPVPAEADLVFPASNAIALQSQVGWYFFVGSATGANGKEYGVEMMFFRNALLPPDVAKAGGLSDTENQAIELQLAISEAGDRHYQAKPILVAGTSGLLSFEVNGFGMSMGKNVARSLKPDSLFPLQVQAWGIDDVPDTVELGIDLTFISGNDYLMQGVDGCMPCCDGIGTLYYSVPNLQLDPAKSNITLKGEKITLTAGTFWFDHQWGVLTGNSQTDSLRAASNLKPADVFGWDWFMAHFNGNRQLTVFAGHSSENSQFYGQTGPTAPGVMTVSVKGKYVDNGKVIDVKGAMEVSEWIKAEDSPDPAQYHPTNTWYPNLWKFTFGPELPDDIRVFTMEPIVDSGQSGFFAIGTQYSEGAVYLKDPKGALVGRGFAESVQYAETTFNVMEVSGLPGTSATLAQLDPGPISATLVAESKTFALQHVAEITKVLSTCEIFNVS